MQPFQRGHNNIPRALFACVFIMVLSLSAHAQSVSVLNKPLNDALRRAQLWGDVPLTSSFCIRPVHASRALGVANPLGPDSVYDFMAVQDSLPTHLLPAFLFDLPLASLGLGDGIWENFIKLQAVPITSRVQFNSHHDYGWQDGPMIPNKGLQTYLNAGIYGKVGIFEFQYAPEWVWAQNQDLPAPGVRVFQADVPDRFGTEVYKRKFLGQSYAKALLGPLSVGLSSENVFWGPGRYAGVLLTDNAPGLRHFTFETNKPLKTRWGTLEGQLVTGNKMRSGFTYLSGPTGDGSSLPEVLRAPEMDSISSVYTSAVGVWNPIWLPGLSLGITRLIWTEGPVSADSKAWDYIALFYSNPFRGVGGGTQAAVDQMAGLFFRYVMPESHAEFYGEYGFDDNRYDLEDMLVSPEHSRAYLIGFSKIHPLHGKNEFFELNYEVTQLEGSKEMINRVQFGYPIFYDSDNSHYGQWLGAGIGSGSNQWILSVDHVKENRRLGFVFERIARNNDQLYAGRVPWVATWYGFDFTKKYVETSLGANYQERFGPFLVWAKALLTQTYNWNHWYDPAGTGSPMRANGYNLKSLNVFTGVTILL